MTCICEYEFCYRCGGEYNDGCMNCEDIDGEDIEDEGDEDDY